MKEALLGKLVLVLSRATPEELAAIYYFATDKPLESAGCGVRGAELKRGRADGSSAPGAKGGRAYVFRKNGGLLWEVVIDEGDRFYLADTLGARYLDYLLHHPNEPISAFDLEVLIQPEKGEARSKDSIQPESDRQAVREYRQALGSLRLERKRARQAGDRAKARELERDIGRVKAALNEHGGMADTGKRARDNVRKAVGAVKASLGRGGREERAFAEHLRTHLSIGIECLHTQPQGRVWD
jgi:hypothetical protein